MKDKIETTLATIIVASIVMAPVILTVYTVGYFINIVSLL